VFEIGIKPNHVTFVGLFTECSHAGMVEQGQQLFLVPWKNVAVLLQLPIIMLAYLIFMAGQDS
jgi:hypothetical protein